MNPIFSLTIPKAFTDFLQKHTKLILGIVLTLISIGSFIFYYTNGLGLAYNDARSHLDIGRRVVENLKPGFAQLGSVWLPLPHLLMTITIWNDFMWHSGLSGAIQSMASYVATGLLIYTLLQKLGVSLLGRLVGVSIFALNMNIIYMQSTALTELLLIATMTAGVYELIFWHKDGSLYRLIKSGFWIMLSTLIRYDGWFLLIFASALVAFHTYRHYGYKTTEGIMVLFGTLAGFGIFIWLFWNQMIFDNALYFAFGPYSAHAQQDQLEAAGRLATKHNLLVSIQTYLAAVAYNAGLLTLILGAVGGVMFFFDKKISPAVRIAFIAFLSPLFFNITTLFLGHSALFVPGISSNTWFNVRYGVMLLPTLAFFIGYLIDKIKNVKYVFIGILLLTTSFTMINNDAVTIDDALFGSSGFNDSKVAGFLHDNASGKTGYVLISVSSHDQTVFSSRLPMKQFIHEGTGLYWDLAMAHPDRYVRWVVMRSHDSTDTTSRLIEKNPIFVDRYQKMGSFPYADVYELKPQYIRDLQPLPALKNNN